MYNSLINGSNKQQSKNTNLEFERRSRIFDTKIRQIGIDVDALNSQIQEKNNEKDFERERNKKFDAFNALLHREDLEMKKRNEMDKRIAAKQLNDFRRVKQRLEDGREYDINFPKHWNKSKPFVYSYNETERVRFEAENYDEEKAKMKVVQLKNCLKAQIEERKATKHNLKVAEKQWGNDCALESSLYKQCIATLERAKIDENKNVLIFNMLKARENVLNKNTEKLKNDTEVMAHIYNCLTSDFYLENPELAASALGEHRINRNYFKGMSDDEINKIMETRAKQIQEKKNIKSVEKSMNKYFDTYQATRSREEKFEDEILEQRKRDICRRINDENKLLAKEQLIRKREMNKIAKSNEPTQEFFDQFNKTSR